MIFGFFVLRIIIFNFKFLDLVKFLCLSWIKATIRLSRQFSIVIIINPISTSSFVNTLVFVSNRRLETILFIRTRLLCLFGLWVLWLSGWVVIEHLTLYLAFFAIHELICIIRSFVIFWISHVVRRFDFCVCFNRVFTAIRKTMFVMLIVSVSRIQEFHVSVLQFLIFFSIFINYVFINFKNVFLKQITFPIIK